MSQAVHQKTVRHCDLLSLVGAWLNREENVLVTTSPQVGETRLPYDSSFPEELAGRVARLHASGSKGDVAGGFESADYKVDDFEAGHPR